MVFAVCLLVSAISLASVRAWRLHAQGWENYTKEFKQLRRSFRYNEYKDIRKLNPPTTFVGRVRSGLACYGEPGKRKCSTLHQAPLTAADAKVAAADAEVRLISPGQCAWMLL